MFRHRWREQRVGSHCQNRREGEVSRYYDECGTFGGTQRGPYRPEKNLLQTQTGHRTHPTVLGTHRSEVGRYGEIKGIISGGVEAEAESSAWVVEESEEDNRCK